MFSGNPRIPGTIERCVIPMDEKNMIDDLVQMLDSGMLSGVGHVNVDFDAASKQSKNVQTMGCSDCSRTPLACSIPTLHEGLDDYK